MIKIPTPKDLAQLLIDKEVEEVVEVIVAENYRGKKLAVMQLSDPVITILVKAGYQVHDDSAGHRITWKT